MAISQEPLSVRNNNPGNLRFVGQEGATQGEGGFARFDSPEAGLNAMRKQIELDTQTRGMNLTQFLTKYAPPSENKTQSYVDFVVRKTGVDPTSPISPDQIPAIQAAMIEMEGGSRAANRFNVASAAPTSQTPAPRTQAAVPRTTKPAESMQVASASPMTSVKPAITDLPPSYRAALAANYIADTEDPEVSIADKAMAMLEEMQTSGGGPRGAATFMRTMGQEEPSANPFAIMAKAQEPAETRRRVVPKMPVLRMADGGEVSNEVPRVDAQGRVIREAPTPERPLSLREKIVGGGEAALSLLSGLTAPASIAYDVMRNVSRNEVSPSRFMYTPRTEGGQRTAEELGRLMQEYKLDVATPQVQLQRPYPVGAAARQGITALELPGVSKEAPVGALFPKKNVDTSQLLPQENKPFIGQLERMVADLPGPVTKEQFLGMVRKQGRNYEIARAEQALENLDAGSKIEPVELFQRLQPTSPNRYTTEIISPGTKDLWDKEDNPYPSKKPGSVNLLLDMDEKSADALRLKTAIRDSSDKLARPDFYYSDEYAKLIPVLEKAAAVVGKNPEYYTDPLTQAAEKIQRKREITKASDDLTMPAISDIWNKYSFAVGDEIPSELRGGEWGYLATHKLLAKVYLNAIPRLKKQIPDYADIPGIADEIANVEKLASQALKTEEGDLHFKDQQYKLSASTANLGKFLDKYGQDLFDDFTKTRANFADRIDELGKELPAPSYEGMPGHRRIVKNNPISFSRYVTFTPEEMAQFGISLPDDKRGAAMFLELQSDRQKALRKNEGPGSSSNVEEAFPNMTKLWNVTQQLMAKNAIYGGIKMNKGLVLFPGSDSKKPNIYKNLDTNLRQVVKDLGPGFKLEKFEFPNEKGEMATRWGVYIDEDAAQRVMTQGMRFAKGGIVDKPLYDRAV